jgi:hypothetical protein
MRKRLARAKKHEQLTLDRWKCVLWSRVQIGMLGSNCCVLVRCGVGERMISACVFPTVKHVGGVLMVWGCFAGDTVIYLEFHGTLNQHGYHSFPSGLGLVGPSFVFQQDNDPTHLQDV